MLNRPPTEVGAHIVWEPAGPVSALGQQWYATALSIVAPTPFRNCAGFCSRTGRWRAWGVFDRRGLPQAIECRVTVPKPDLGINVPTIIVGKAGRDRLAWARLPPDVASGVHTAIGELPGPQRTVLQAELLE